jgi:hypothetical protein
MIVAMSMAIGLGAGAAAAAVSATGAAGAAVSFEGAEQAAKPVRTASESRVRRGDFKWNSSGSNARRQVRPDIGRRTAHPTAARARADVA